MTCRLCTPLRLSIRRQVRVILEQEARKAVEDADGNGSRPS